MNYRRSKLYGGTFFFTLVTYRRKFLFNDRNNINLLKKVIKHVKFRHPFSIDAFVLLPDHLHCIWTLPPNDTNYSMRWRLIKSNFTRIFSSLNAKLNDENEYKLWQKRFWEHQIRGEQDFISHVEYIHYNPVKHGYVHAPAEWEYSSFHRYVQEAIYTLDWGSKKNIILNENIGNE